MRYISTPRMGPHTAATVIPLFTISFRVIWPVPYSNENAGIATGVHGAMAVAIAAVMARSCLLIPKEGARLNSTGTRMMVAELLLTKFAKSIASKMMIMRMAMFAYITDTFSLSKDVSLPL